MSDYIYENRQLSLWDEYRDLNGRVSFEAFMERHFKVNAYIVNLLKKFGTVSAEIDRSESAKRFAEMDLIQMGD
jgi:hypothetical protein